MSISTDQYAELSDHSYNDIGVGVRPHGKEDQVTLKGITSKILDHASTPRTADREPLSLSWLHRHPPLRRIALEIAALLTTFSLSACHMQNPMTKMAAASADVPVIAFKGDGPVYAHRNPHPRHVYELIIQTDEAPGAFNGSYASISMTAKSSACAPVHGFPIGAASIPSAFVEFPLKKISDTQYRGYFATDLLVDESYWTGKPPCEWDFVAISFSLSATGADKETGFNGSIDAKELASGQPVKRYYWKGHYPKLADMGSLDSFSTDGSKNVGEIQPKMRDNLFTITATAHEVRS
ncbi:hypothetical protein [Brachymonas sp.]|uniref:hypothetical protein n=1 Tax=Brachymonas sp. TaxID=1936292 RepID=UPI0035B4C345